MGFDLIQIRNELNTRITTVMFHYEALSQRVVRYIYSLFTYLERCGRKETQQNVQSVSFYADVHVRHRGNPSIGLIVSNGKSTIGVVRRFAETE